MKTLLATLAAASVLATAAPAIARDVQSVTVTYDDLNLATLKGQERLDRRIDSAVRKVCGSAQRSATRILDPKVTACMKEARAKARSRVAAEIDAERLGG